MKFLYALLSAFGDSKAASRGPGPFVRRKVRAQAHKTLAKTMRRSKWTRP